MPNSSSKRITSSTVSSESAPRSSMNRALGVTSFSSTPSSSTMICFTLFSISGSGISFAPLDGIKNLLGRQPLRGRGCAHLLVLARGQQLELVSDIRILDVQALNVTIDLA